MTTPQPPIGIVADENLFAPLLGRLIGTGATRVVVEAVGHLELVIKIAYRPVTRANWSEWLIWEQIADQPALADAFGACRAISASGRYLLMERLDDLPAVGAPPRSAPEWTTDLTPDAWGVDPAGRVKLRDYANLALSRVLARLPLVRRY